MSDYSILLDELKQELRSLDATIRHCAALVCSVVITAGIPGLDTPEKVVRACKMVHQEIIHEMREGTLQ